MNGRADHDISRKLKILNHTIEIDTLTQSFEFPSFDRRFPFAEQTVFGVSDSKRSTGMDTMQSAIIELNPTTGAEQHFDYGSDVVVEEPQFINDDTGKTSSGYILHSYLNFRTQKTGLAILRSGSISEGPIMQAEMDRCLPLGFHGCFVPG